MQDIEELAEYILELRFLITLHEDSINLYSRQLEDQGSAKMRKELEHKLYSTKEELKNIKRRYRYYQRKYGI